MKLIYNVSILLQYGNGGGDAMFSLQLSQGHRHKVVPQLVGGATESIFPEVEALLLQSEYCDALLHFASRKNMGKYHSVMDFFFCELHTEWRKACEQFYRGDSPPLKELIDVQQLQLFNRRMLIALRAAQILYIQEPFEDWGLFCKIVEDAIATNIQTNK